jgi:hypothetical protein
MAANLDIALPGWAIIGRLLNPTTIVPGRIKK